MNSHLTLENSGTQRSLWCRSWKGKHTFKAAWGYSCSAFVHVAFMSSFELSARKSAVWLSLPLSVWSGSFAPLLWVELSTAGSSGEFIAGDGGRKDNWPSEGRWFIRSPTPALHSIVDSVTLNCRSCNFFQQTRAQCLLVSLCCPEFAVHTQISHLQQCQAFTGCRYPVKMYLEQNKLTCATPVFADLWAAGTENNTMNRGITWDWQMCRWKTPQ